MLRETADCLQDAELAYTQEIAAIRDSPDPPARQARKIARREHDIATGRRYLVTSWFDIAVADYHLADTAQARQFAERVVGDEQLGGRAKEILARLAG